MSVNSLFPIFIVSPAKIDHLKIRRQIIDLPLFAILRTPCKLSLFLGIKKAAADVVNHSIQRLFLICDSHPLYKYKALSQRGAFENKKHGGGR